MAKTPKAAAATDGDAPKAPRKARAAKAAGGAKPARAAKAARTAKPARAEPAPISGPVEGGTMKGKHLLERVAARSGVARTAAKPVIDAVLVELHDALARGEMLLLPGLGKLKVKPAKEGAKGSGMQIKLLPIKPGKGEGQDAEKDGDTPLAPTED